jgi:alkanesulfonate monooxygenase SsuD/methylene tetrahydromethanopterin reductase-like flavin-dependent oxidoreductase (luciferase family)
VSFDGFVTTGEAIALAQRAVEMGARSLWVAEHLGYREAIATCVALERRYAMPIDELIDQRVRSRQCDRPPLSGPGGMLV